MAECWFRVEEIAHPLGVTPITVYRWLEKDTMPAHRVGRLWKFKSSEIDPWVKHGGAAKKAKVEHSKRDN